MRREFNRHYLSLLHFDFPYFAEPDSGCRDELNICKWHNTGCKFAGQEIPYDEQFAPKFGYRCLRSRNSGTYLEASSGADIFGFDPGKSCTFEFFIYPQGQGPVLTLYSGSSAVFAIAIDSSNKLAVTGAGSYNVSFTPVNLTLNTWQHIAICISATDLKVYINGTQAGTGSTSLAGTPNITSARLGGFSGYLDEFLYRDDLSHSVPSEPYKGMIDIDSLGGYGDSKHGAASFTAANSNLRINTTAYISKIIDSSTFTYAGLQTFTHGDFEAGDEIMLLLKQSNASIYQEAGLYSFRRVKTRSGSNITLDSPVNEFTFNAQTPANYRVELYKVPNYASFNLASNVIIKPNNGVCVFRVAGDCVINGKILTHGTNNYARQDLLQMCNSELPERFLTNTSGGIFIACGGTLTIDANARLGGDYSGESGAGQGVKGNAGTSGGAGYGGAGGACSNHKGTGGNGGVGGGGGAGDKGIAGSAGTSGTGGYGLSMNSARYEGGTQGRNSGGSSPKNGSNESGGAGALGNTGNASAKLGGYAGACILLACKTLKCDLAAISTGGQGGAKGTGTSGGGGSGMCYIACETCL